MTEILNYILLHWKMLYLIGYVLLWVIIKWESGPMEDWGDFLRKFFVCLFSWIGVIIWLIVTVCEKADYWFHNTKPPKWL